MAFGGMGILGVTKGGVKMQKKLLVGLTVCVFMLGVVGMAEASLISVASPDNDAQYVSSSTTTATVDGAAPFDAGGWSVYRVTYYDGSDYTFGTGFTYNAALIEMDLSKIPSNASIDNAILNINVAKVIQVYNYDTELAILSHLRSSGYTGDAASDYWHINGPSSEVDTLYHFYSGTSTGWMQIDVTNDIRIDADEGINWAAFWISPAPWEDQLQIVGEAKGVSIAGADYNAGALAPYLEIHYHLLSVSEPDISVTDSSDSDNDLEVPFGDIPNTSHTVTVTNLGDVDLKIGQIPYVLDQPGLFRPFSITDNCSNQTLAPSATCTLTILFIDPSPDTGSWGKVIRIPSDDPDESEVVVSMCGTSPGVPWPWTVSGTVPERVDAEAFERVTGSCLPKEGNHTPARPEPVSPEDGATGLETTVTFQWNGVTDLEGDPVTYEIRYCEDNEGIQENCVAAKVEGSTLTGSTNRTVYAGLGAGAGLLLFGVVIAGDGRRRRIALLAGMIILTAMLLVSCGKGTVTDVGGDVSGDTDTAILSYTVDGLSPDITYTWQVVASDDKGASNLSYVRSFTTGN